MNNDNNKFNYNNLLKSNIEKVNNFYFSIFYTILVLLLILLVLYLVNVKGFNKYFGITIFFTLSILLVIYTLIISYKILEKNNFQYKNIYLLFISLISIGLILLFIYYIGILNINNNTFNLNLLINYIIFFIFLTLLVFYNYKLYNNSNIQNLSKENIKIHNERLKYSLIFILYLILVIALYIYNPYGLMTKYSGITLFGIIFIGVVLFSMILIYNYYFSNLNNINKNNIPNITYFLQFLYIILALFISGLLFYFFLYLLGAFNQNTNNNIGYYIFNVLFLLGLLTILYKLIFVGGYLNKNPLYRVIINTILFIPCALNNLILILQKNFNKENIKLENIKFRKDIYFLILSIILIILYFLITYIIYPLLERYYFVRNGKQIINEPLELNKSSVIATYENLNGSLKTDYSYGMSFWIYIDSFPNKKMSSILDYGGIPKISYNGLNNTLIISVKNKSNINKLTKNYNENNNENENTNENKIIYKKEKFKLQKWNNIIINYNNGFLDIFLNNKLVASSINVTPYIKYDSLVIGEQNGIYGNICNLIYYNKPISIFQINNIYVNLKSKNPPILVNKL